MSEEKKKDSLALKPTGRMSVIVEMEEWGPIEFKINDVDMTLAVVGVLSQVPSIVVDKYTKRDRKTFERLLPSAAE